MRESRLRSRGAAVRGRGLGRGGPRIEKSFDPNTFMLDTFVKPFTIRSSSLASDHGSPFYGERNRQKDRPRRTGFAAGPAERAPPRGRGRRPEDGASAAPRRAADPRTDPPDVRVARPDRRRGEAADPLPPRG